MTACAHARAGATEPRPFTAPAPGSNRARSPLRPAGHHAAQAAVGGVPPDSHFSFLRNLRRFPGRFGRRRTFVHFGAETLIDHGVRAKAPRRTCRWLPRKGKLTCL